MVCRYCGEDKPLGKSHIIPKSFWPIDKDDPRPSRLLCSSEDIRPQRSRRGVYDETILCHECEVKFGKWDTYGAKLLLSKENEFRPIVYFSEIIGYSFEPYDYEKLKRFILSVLWRASVSTHDFYRLIKLGPREDKALSLFNSQTPIPPEAFPVFLTMFDDPLSKCIQTPIQAKVDGINFSIFYMGKFAVYIQTDSRMIHKTYSDFILRPGTPITVLSREYLGSREHRVLHKAALAPHNHL
jgi:hypothetical protein